MTTTMLKRLPRLCNDRGCDLCRSKRMISSTCKLFIGCGIDSFAGAPELLIRSEPSSWSVASRFAPAAFIYEATWPRSLKTLSSIYLHFCEGCRHKHVMCGRL